MTAPLTLTEVDPEVLDVRILTAEALEARAAEALAGYVGDTLRVAGNISAAVQIVAANAPAQG